MSDFPDTVDRYDATGANINTGFDERFLHSSGQLTNQFVVSLPLYFLRGLDLRPNVRMQITFTRASVSLMNERDYVYDYDFRIPFA